MTGTSPPGPFRCGSTTCSTRPAATAASKALPPCSSTAMPAAEASQWVDATMPNVPASCGLVVNCGLAVTGGRPALVRKCRRRRPDSIAERALQREVTSGQVSLPREPLHRWLDVRADRLRQGAAGSEPAARWRVDRARQLAGDALTHLGLLGLRVGHRRGV